MALRRMTDLFLVAAVLVSIPLLAKAETPNPLLGSWQVDESAKPAGWIGFQQIEFTEAAMFSEGMSIPVRYDFDGTTAEVEAETGETYRYEFVGPNRICVPPPELQGIEPDAPIVPEGMDSQICYERVTA